MTGLGSLCIYVRGGGRRGCTARIVTNKRREKRFHVVVACLHMSSQCQHIARPDSLSGTLWTHFGLGPHMIRLARPGVTPLQDPARPIYELINSSQKAFPTENSERKSTLDFFNGKAFHFKTLLYRVLQSLQVSRMGCLSPFLGQGN